MILEGEVNPAYTMLLDYDCIFIIVFPTAALTLPTGTFGTVELNSTAPIHFLPLCLGTEEAIFDCPLLYIDTCSHDDDTAIRCFNSGENIVNM